MFIVTCREDRKLDGEAGDYSLATRTVFGTREAALAYCAGIASGREPLIIEGSFKNLRFDEARGSADYYWDRAWIPRN